MRCAQTIRESSWSRTPQGVPRPASTPPSRPRTARSWSGSTGMLCCHPTTSARRWRCCSARVPTTSAVSWPPREPRTSSDRSRARCARVSGSGRQSFHTGGQEGEALTVYLGAFTRSALERVGGYDEAYVRAQDWEMNHRIRQSGGLVWFTPDMQVTYRPRSTVKALAKQYLHYGRWRREIMRQHRQTVSLRYLAAPTAVTVIALGVTGAAVGAATGRRRAWLGSAAGHRLCGRCHGGGPGDQHSGAGVGACEGAAGVGDDAHVLGCGFPDQPTGSATVTRTVTAVICAFGAEPHLAEVVAAVARSTGVRTEVIVVDNGSPACEGLPPQTRVLRAREEHRVRGWLQSRSACRHRGHSGLHQQRRAGRAGLSGTAGRSGARSRSRAGRCHGAGLR